MCAGSGDCFGEFTAAPEEGGEKEDTPICLYLPPSFLTEQRHSPVSFVHLPFYWALGQESVSGIWT